LIIVRTVASRWGVVPYGDGIGKTVWFELDLVPPPMGRRRHEPDERSRNVKG
jgi:hypothetical protein